MLFGGGGDSCFWKGVDAIEDNDEEGKAYGIQLGPEMCKQLLEAGV